MGLTGASTADTEHTSARTMLNSGKAVLKRKTPSVELHVCLSRVSARSTDLAAGCRSDCRENGVHLGEDGPSVWQEAA